MNTIAELITKYNLNIGTARYILQTYNTLLHQQYRDFTVIDINYIREQQVKRRMMLLKSGYPKK